MVQPCAPVQNLQAAHPSMQPRDILIDQRPPV